MRLYSVLTGLAFAALVTAFGFHRWILAKYAPGMGSLGAFFDAAPVVKLMMMLCLLAVIAASVLALVGAASGLGGGELAVVLSVVAFGAIIAGAVGAGYGELNTQAAIDRIGPVRFEVTAPSRAEDLLCLSLGLLAGTIGFAGAAWLGGRPAGRSGAPAG